MQTHRKDDINIYLELDGTVNFNKGDKILVPASQYILRIDKRMLIPVAFGDKIGFINHAGQLIVSPKYCTYYEIAMKMTMW